MRERRDDEQVHVALEEERREPEDHLRGHGRSALPRIVLGESSPAVRGLNEIAALLTSSRAER